LVTFFNDTTSRLHVLHSSIGPAVTFDVALTCMWHSIMLVSSCLCTCHCLKLVVSSTSAEISRVRINRWSPLASDIVSTWPCGRSLSIMA